MVDICRPYWRKMVVFSSLRVSSPTILANFIRCRSTTAPLLSALKTQNVEIVRQMGSHKRVMYITPSRFQWHKFKDAFHFYFMLGVIPLTALVLYVNIFIGPAELAEIPEGYQPKNWEYYDHPIKRFFATYLYPSHQQEYEKYLHHLKEEYDKQRLRQLEDKVKQHMAVRGDYQAWYFRPMTAKYVRQHRRQTDEQYAAQGDN